VAEGEDQGTTLSLTEEGRPYLVGRAAHCDLPLADADVSREHVRVMVRRSAVLIEDLGTKNGTALGGAALGEGRSVTWRSTQMLKLGRTVVALVEPVAQALAAIETAEDEVLPESAAIGTGKDASGGLGAPAASAKEAQGAAASASRVSTASAASEAAARGRPRQGLRWSAVDVAVMGAALGVLALSLVGIYWLLRAT
jgi:pilus assembly protein CpaF